MKDLIRKLTEAYGPSGAEDQIRELIRAEVEPLADEVRVDPLGSLIAVKKGAGKRIVLDAHMDEIGLMVSYVDEKGFARVTSIGGVSPLTCIGGRVVFADGTVGVIGVDEKRERSKPPQLSQLYVDVGATSQADCPMQVGDAAGFVRPFVATGSRLISKTMDDRIGCVVLIQVLRRLKTSPHEVHFVFSVQEEVGLRGARASAYGVDPDLAIAVDITAAGDMPESKPRAISLGEGPAIKVQDRGMIAHPAVRELLVKTAKKNKIPYQLEVLELGTTDAAAIQLTRAGVPAGCVSIPCRYFHSPSEMVDLADVENAIKLLVAAVKAV